MHTRESKNYRPTVTKFAAFVQVVCDTVYKIANGRRLTKL